jgi:hypothetical protein
MIDIPLWIQLSTAIIALVTLFRSVNNAGRIDFTNLRLKNLKFEIKRIEDAIRLLELDFKKLENKNNEVK